MTLLRLEGITPKEYENISLKRDQANGNDRLSARSRIPYPL